MRIIATVQTGETGITADSETIHGEILKVAIDVTGNSMDINLDTLGEAKAQAILDYTGNTDTTFYPRTPAEDNTGTDVTYDGTNEIYVPFVVFGKLRLTLASAAAAETVTIIITFRD